MPTEYNPFQKIVTWIMKWFLRYDTKSISSNNKIDKLGFNNLKNARKRKDKL